MPTAADFQRELEIFRAETQGAIQFFYAWQVIHDVAGKEKDVLRAINRTPLFWRTTLGALQSSAVIALGRVFDPDQNNHSVSRLLVMAHANLHFFSKAALAERKRQLDKNADEWLPEYLRDVYEPTSDDFRRLKRYLNDRRKTYISNYRDLRHRVFAHRSAINQTEIEALFAKTNIRELQRLLTFLSRLYEALWQLLMNGRKPVLRPERYSVRRMRDQPSSQYEQGNVQERVVLDTERVLRALANAARPDV